MHWVEINSSNAEVTVVVDLVLCEAIISKVWNLVFISDFTIVI